MVYRNVYECFGVYEYFIIPYSSYFIYSFIYIIEDYCIVLGSFIIPSKDFSYVCIFIKTVCDFLSRATFVCPLIVLLNRNSIKNDNMCATLTIAIHDTL